NRTLGQRLPGLQGTAVASLVTAAAWIPIAVTWFAFHAPTAAAIALAVACGLMSSIAPYVADLLALRRVPAQVFGTFTSINPVWAALAGWLVLHQALDLNEWIGIGLIVISNVAISARAPPRQPIPSMIS
ncbi:MAG TPA: EamA family transporter, partial [Geodermatophilus sp.]|nr:EamA family transporter [Geodermatophilus sp.]